MQQTIIFGLQSACVGTKAIREGRSMQPRTFHEEIWRAAAYIYSDIIKCSGI